jgi:hypothetical protein
MIWLVDKKQLSEFNTYTINSLKNLAIIFMLIDHYSLITNTYSFLHYIGRIAFPIFAFIIVYNFIYNTKSKYTSLMNYLIIAIISQIPYYFIVQDQLNIFFTFLLSLGAIYIIFYTETSEINKMFVLISTFSLSYFSDFSIFGYLFILYIYLFLTSIKYVNYDTFIFSSLSLLFISTFLNGFEKLYFMPTILTTFLLIFIFNFNYKIDIFSYRFNKYVYYLFYPLHFVIIWAFL